LAVVALSLWQVAAQDKTDNLTPILSSELNRQAAVLGQLSPAAYFIGYRVDEVKNVTLQASFGFMAGEDTLNVRYLTTSLRAGDYNFDNTHVYKGEVPKPEYSARELPLENNALALRQILWDETDNLYKQARANYQTLFNKKELKSNVQNEALPDFSKEPSTRYTAPETTDLRNVIDYNVWSEKLKQWSSKFSGQPWFMDGSATLVIYQIKTWIVNTEGTQIEKNMNFVRVVLTGEARTDDGNTVPLFRSFVAFDPKDLPSDERIAAEVDDMVSLLTALRNAPLAEPYSGPAILSAPASAVFFHEIFGHRVEGHRLRDESDGQTFKHMLGERVLPKDLNVVFDPTVKHFAGTDLIGYYPYDDEGVKARTVQVVQKGVLRNFLMSRLPIDGFMHSNGHGRAGISAQSVSRQSNMFISSEKPKTEAELRKDLIKACKKSGKPYGYYFKEVTGGFTNTGRFQPNAFNVMPTVVYRIYVDGRPDQLVRGVDLIGTPLTMFAGIEAAGDTPGVFTGFCGAESGQVPVSAISPSLFVKMVETQRKFQTFSKGPILPVPVPEK